MKYTEKNFLDFIKSKNITMKIFEHVDVLKYERMMDGIVFPIKQGYLTNILGYQYETADFIYRCEYQGHSQGDFFSVTIEMLDCCCCGFLYEKDIIIRVMYKLTDKNFTAWLELQMEKNRILCINQDTLNKYVNNDLLQRYNYTTNISYTNDSSSSFRKKKITLEPK